jgi:hypothetical protein
MDLKQEIQKRDKDKALMLVINNWFKFVSMKLKISKMKTIVIDMLMRILKKLAK